MFCTIIFCVGSMRFLISVTIRMLLIGYSFGIRSERRLGMKCISTSPTAGSVVWVLKVWFPIIRRFRRIGMNAFATATSFAAGSKTSCALACGWARRRRKLRHRCERDRGGCKRNHRVEGQPFLTMTKRRVLFAINALAKTEAAEAAKAGMKTMTLAIRRQNRNSLRSAIRLQPGPTKVR
jgi:hypothetical protein